MPSYARDSYLLDLSLTSYREAWDLQLKLVNARAERVLDKDIVMCLEHFPVFTLGRRGGLQHLKVPKAFLESQEIDIIHVERGGDITYHGPGQLVIYPIVDLRDAGWRVVDFVGALEEIMIRAVAEWGIRAERNPLNRGVWVGRSKMGSLGIAVRHGVSFHGLALNVNTALEPFGWVNPCGLDGVMVTSMKQILGREISLADVKRSARRHLEQVFGMNLLPIPLDKMQDLLSSPGGSSD